MVNSQLEGAVRLQVYKFDHVNKATRLAECFNLKLNTNTTTLCLLQSVLLQVPLGFELQLGLRAKTSSTVVITVRRPPLIRLHDSMCDC